jgi:ATP-dependent DNA helicase RecG
VLERSQDGFEIAEADLRIRGPGEFLGVRQSGALPFKMADLVRDKDWLLKAREDVLELLRQDPHLDAQASRPLRDFLMREGRLQLENLKTS